MSNDIKTKADLIDRVISDGIESAKASLALTIETGHKLAGALAGFEICRRLRTPEDYIAELDERHKREIQMHSELLNSGDITSDDYWEYRYATLQIEFVFERVKVLAGFPRVSARAVLQINRLCGQS